MVLLICSSCTKEKLWSQLGQSSKDIEHQKEIKQGFIHINEFVASASQQINEYGNQADWVELYNPNNHDVVMEHGEWFLTDNILHKRKRFALPKIIIPAHSYIVVWCDGKGIYDDEIHSNFKLSGLGENIGLYYEKGEKQIVIDSVIYSGEAGKGGSYGRKKDGSSQWTSFKNPTIGAMNQKRAS
jgi:hypothetical protein